MKSNLYIPKKIKVGYVNNEEAFTGKLGFVNYENEQGELKRLKSFNDWRDDSIPIQSFTNEPQDGFIFNKSIERYGRFNGDTEYVRIYDPRGHEFEITVENALSLLIYSDVIKREISQECVYSWSGQRLVLVPANSKHYKEALDFTNKQSQSVDAKDLVVGYNYSLKKDESVLTYLGYLEVYNFVEEQDFCAPETYGNVIVNKSKKHYFYDLEYKNAKSVNIKTISECVSNTVCESLKEKLETMNEYKKIDRYNKNYNFKNTRFKEINVSNELSNITRSHSSVFIYYKRNENDVITSYQLNAYIHSENFYNKKNVKVNYFNLDNDFSGNVDKKSIISTLNLNKEIFGKNEKLSIYEILVKLKELGFGNISN